MCCILYRIIYQFVNIVIVIVIIITLGPTRCLILLYAFNTSITT